MADRIADILVLGEDSAHLSLVRQFLNAMRCNTRRVRFLPIPEGRGSGEQYVRTSLPAQLRAARARGARQVLIVLTDADTLTVDQRLAAVSRDLSADERDSLLAPGVVLLIPRRNIETWGRCLLCRSPDESTDYSSPPLTPEEWRVSGKALWDWSRPNASIPDKCVDSLRRVLAPLGAIPRPG